MRVVRPVYAGTVPVLLAVALFSRADDEAACANGRRVRGTLTVMESGALHFLPTGQQKPLAAETIEGIRFDSSAAVTPRAGNSLRATLAGGQNITGELLKLDGERARLRPAWAESIELRRASLTALSHPPGFRTIFADGPTDNARAWKATADGRAYELPAALEAGRVGATFKEMDKANAPCRFEAVFQTEAGTRTLGATIAGLDEAYRVDVDGLKGQAREVRRAAGPHQLAVQFSKQSLRVTCDEDVLWFNLEQGPGGSLKQVRLGGGSWSAFYLAQAVGEPRHPPDDADQDEVWLASDDQLFGTMTGADGRAVNLEGRFGKRSLAWAEVRAIYFRRPKERPKSEGNTVRIWLRTGFGAETDVLDGTLMKLDERQFTLKHEELGEVTLDRKWLRELRPLVDRK
jgi:hypothetical protein